MKAFLEATEEANGAFSGSDAEFDKIATASGMDVDTTKTQMAGFIMPNAKEQLEKYFSKGGVAESAAASLGLVFSDSSDGAQIAKTIDGSFLE